MPATLMLLSTLVAVPGQALRIEQAHEPGLAGVELRWGGQSLSPIRANERWLALIGIDLDARLGEHEAEWILEFADGRSERFLQQIEVRPKQYPTTELTVEPKYVEPSAADQARAAAEAREINAIYAALHPEPYWHQPFATPLPDVQGGRNFGHRRVFNGQPRAPHSGSDLRAAEGTPIYAANRGRVVLAKDLFYSGNAVFLDHGQGVFSTYLHLSEIAVEVGAMVERGDLLGLAGATGRVTGPHLHWGVRVVGARVDPFSLLSATADLRSGAEAEMQ